jgi:hypothetical protein
VGAGFAENPDTQRRLDARIVGYIQHCFLLNHCRLSFTSCYLVASLLRSLFQNTDKPPVFGFAVGLTL